METDYKVKIQKLLALTTSPNANEALVAAKKARELMIKHKLSEADLKEDVLDEVVIVKVAVDSKSRVELYSIIANNNRCECVFTRKGANNYIVTCYGFKGDVRFVRDMFFFLNQAMEDGLIECKRSMKTDFPDTPLYGVSKAYRSKFTYGVNDAFKSQVKENQEWGLVLVTPKKVVEKMKIENPKLREHPLSRGSNVRSNAVNAAGKSGYSRGFESVSRKGRKELSA